MSKKPSLIDAQIAHNLEAVAGWTRYQSHREIVMQLLCQPVEPTSSSRTLCILGAGNCNDIDLPQLLTEFSEITLIDIDTAAVTDGLSRQGVSSVPEIKIVEIDVTGALPWLSQASILKPPDLTELTERCSIGIEIGTFYVVASLGLLSQVIGAVECLYTDPDQKLVAVSAIRKQHIKLLLEALQPATTHKPAGIAILVNEVVSSETLPELQTVAAEDLPQLLQIALANGNFFSGLNPMAVLKATQSMLDSRQSAGLAGPWIWQYIHRAYVCYALIINDASLMMS